LTVSTKTELLKAFAVHNIIPSVHCCIKCKVVAGTISKSLSEVLYTET
jgi:hypothetical protein